MLASLFKHNFCPTYAGYFHRISNFLPVFALCFHLFNKLQLYAWQNQNIIGNITIAGSATFLIFTDETRKVKLLLFPAATPTHCSKL